jgi:DNA repair exonuclease SbcCD nuclease subunit
MKGISTGDWHFDALEKHFGDDAINRQVFEIEKMMKYSIAKGIPHFFINGDIANSPILSCGAWIALYHLLKKYDGLLNIYYIAGNHDFAERGKTSLDFLKVLCANGTFKTVHIFLEPETRKIEDTYVNFCPYPVLEAPDTKRGALNMCHVEYNGALGDNGRKLRVKQEAEFTQPDKDFCVSGHIHTYQFLETKRAVYAGSPYQMNFGESLPKGFIRFESQSKKDHVHFDHRVVNGNPSFTLEQLVIKKTKEFSQLKKDDSIRYKLWIGDSVKVPQDLLSRFPNITGGVFDLATKKKTENIVEREELKSHTFDLQFGLKKFLKQQGHNKKQVRDGISILQEAMSELGIARNF